MQGKAAISSVSLCSPPHVSAVHVFWTIPTWTVGLQLHSTSVKYLVFILSVIELLLNNTGRFLKPYVTSQAAIPGKTLNFIWSVTGRGQQQDNHALVLKR